MRNVIVTGGSRGLGLGIARTLTASGHHVVAIARRETDALSNAIRDAGECGVGAIRFRQADLNELSGLAGLAKGIRDEFGPIYGLVNNAGIGTSGLLASMSDAQIEELFHLNVVSTLTLTKHVIRAMMTNTGGGRIVNIASIAAFTGYNGLAAYGATKAALIGFTRAVAREVGPLGITVNAVAPGFIATEMTEDVKGQKREQIVRRAALHRLAEIDDVAETVDFLISDKSRNITGTVVTVDAGNVA